MKIKCINDYATGNSILNCRIYKVLKETINESKDKFYSVMNDKGNIEIYISNRFIIVEK